MIFSKVDKFVQNSLFSPRSARFVIFVLGAQPFSDFSKVHTFVENSLFSLISARLVIFALSEPLFSNFQQSERVCSKQFSANDFQQSARFVHNSVFSPISARFLVFALGTPLFRVFSKVHEFVQNRSFLPEIRTLCHFRTGRTTF